MINPAGSLRPRRPPLDAPRAAALDDLVRGGERVLDLGCGSGVLAMAALALGAARAVGVDIDPATLAATVDAAAPA